MSKNERRSNVSWRDAQIECTKCGEAGAVLDRVVQDSERVRLEFGCPFCSTLSVMEFVDVFHFGQISEHHDRPTRQSFYRLEDSVAERYRKVNATYLSDVPEPEPEPVVVAPEPVVARESEAERREKQQQIERTANALEAHRKIAELVLSKRRGKLAFANRNTVVSRLVELRKQWVWAVDASNPAIEEILNDHGGKLIVGKLWEDLKLILATQKKHWRGGMAAQRTFSVTLGSRTQAHCYLFPAKSLEDARKGALQIGSLF